MQGGRKKVREMKSEQEKKKKVRKLCLNSNKTYPVGIEFLFVSMCLRLSISEGTPAFS